MKDNQIVGLGIETSCDETSVAVVEGGGRPLANVIYSQIDEHSPFRGVVPEIASRAHLEKINPVYFQAMEEAGIEPEELDYIAVTSRPGLAGSLMIGAQMARCLALVHGTPLIACNHLEAHFYAVTLEGAPLEYPTLGLLLSGGNSSIYQIDGPEDMTCIGDTYDDALGEAFDKVSTILGLSYPGGPAIEKMADSYQPGAGPEESLFPRLLKNVPGTEVAFSFSGLKTAVLRANRDGAAPDRICSDFQDRAFELVERMLKRAVKNTGIKNVVASGGVLANSTLRGRLQELARRQRLVLRSPESRFLCTDNAGMVAALGYVLHQKGVRSELDFSISSKR